MGTIDHRNFLRHSDFALARNLAAGSLPQLGTTALAAPGAKGKADSSLNIQACKLEIVPGVVVRTTAFNRRVPGPLLRVCEGVPVTIDVTHSSTSPDIVQWHGFWGG
jgi:FtsP/CotA-like multicopper oxidase with cupredoxin domain